LSPSSHRSPARRLRSRRALVVAGVLAAVVAAPGVASADDAVPADPGAALQQTVEGALGQVAGGLGGGSGVPSLPVPGAAPAPAPEAAPAAESEEGPLPGVPPELLGALQSLLTPLGVPDTCVQGVADGVEDLLNGILSQDPQAALEDLLGGLEGALTGLASGQAPSLDPAVLAAGAADVATDVQALLAAFQACLPELPAAPEIPAPAPQPAPEAPVAAPVAAPVTAQPAQYLGYAPTGGDEGVETDGPGATLPLAVLGGALLAAGGAGAAVSRARSRAVGR
jgi:hypothetical protein